MWGTFVINTISYRINHKGIYKISLQMLKTVNIRQLYFLKCRLQGRTFKQLSCNEEDFKHSTHWFVHILRL